jgi:hypothetical protein
MFAHLSSSGIDLAKNVLSFATALISFLALFKKTKKIRYRLLKKNEPLVS